MFFNLKWLINGIPVSISMNMYYSIIKQLVRNK